MRKIIIPTDFSENSKNAAVYAMHLFKDTSCIFYFLHTFSPAIYTYDYQLSSGVYGGDLYKSIKDNVNKDLTVFTKDIESIFNNPNHKFVTITACNMFLDEIRALVKEKNADLIIMGTKGATASKEVLFGSNTVHVMNKARCPVIAVPNTYDFTNSKQLTLPINYKNDFEYITPKNILFPTDYKVDYSDRQLDILKTIASKYNSNIHIMHVSHGELDSDEKQKQAILKSALSDYNMKFLDVEDQEIPDAVESYQKAHTTQLLMMINNKHTFLENLFFKPVISKIGMHLTTPFLVIPASSFHLEEVIH